MKTSQIKSFNATIFIAGDYAKALQVCQAHCDEVGLCVTVEPTTYVYTGGAEAGVRVGLINYPRFAAMPWDIYQKAKALALKLLEELEQESLTIVDSDVTTWFSRRPADVCELQRGN